MSDVPPAGSCRSHPDVDALQFDRIATESPLFEADRATPAVRCSACEVSIDTEYYDVNGRPVCAACRRVLETNATMSRGLGPLFRAGVFGFGAAIGGALIYYAVIAITHLQIGIVAILIGYMVGYSVRKGAAGRGGRRFQILALVLTYWSVGLAYTPLFFKGMSEAARQRAADSRAGDSTQGQTPATSDRAKAAPSATDNGRTAASSDMTVTSTNTPRIAAKPPTFGAFLIGIGALLAFTFVLPVLQVFLSLPSGLIGAFIIVIGLHQAWRMTAAPTLEISGPYRVGARSSPATT